MARAVVFLAEVESDIGEAYWWYEEKDLGLGDEFLRCLEEAFYRISDHPEHFPIRFDDVRRVLVRRFPYAVYFYHDDERLHHLRVSYGTEPTEAFRESKESEPGDGGQRFRLRLNRASSRRWNQKLTESPKN